MIYSDHIPNNNTYVQQIYTADGGGLFLIRWQKPKNAVMVHFFCQAAGLQGGNGVAGLAGLAGGGGGGAPGGLAHALFMANFLPDVLNISISSTNIDIQEPAVSQNSSYFGRWFSTYIGLDTHGIISAGHNFSTAAGNGTTAAGGVAGGVTNLQNYTTSRPCFPSLSTALNFLTCTPNYGPGGVAGGFDSVGASDTKLVTISNNGGALVTCGTGGGGLPATGNGWDGGALSILDLNNFTTGITIIPGGVGTAGDGGNGLPGFQPIKNVPYWTGGTGGASGAALGGNGGNGGDGAYGCGGGGGGGCLTGSTPGVGGKGGNPILIITSW